MVRIYDLKGALTFNKPVDKELMDFINAFARTRHMCRNNKLIRRIYSDWEKHCYQGRLGFEGAYFVGGEGSMGQAIDQSITHHNMVPAGMPGFWCQWIIKDAEDEQYLAWNESEYFDDADKWLNYIITHFFAPLNYILNGELLFEGMNKFGSPEKGKIIVRDNEVTVLSAPEKLTAGLLRELLRGSDKYIPQLEALIKDKSDYAELSLIDENDYIAVKTWCDEDVAGVITEEGLEPTSDNIAKVINSGELDALSDCTDRDWEIVHDAVKLALK